MGLDIYLEIEVDTGNVPYTAELFHSNITHNVTPMWRKAGVFDALYESNGKCASEVVDVLNDGILNMSRYPEKYKMLNPENGWGSYEGAIQFLVSFASACASYPKAVIYVSR